MVFTMESNIPYARFSRANLSTPESRVSLPHKKMLRFLGIVNGLFAGIESVNLMGVLCQEGQES